MDCSETRREVDRCRDVAQEVITALLFDERELAGQLIAGYDRPDWLAYTLADIVRCVHNSWSEAYGMNPHDTWQQLALDLAKQRLT